MERAAGNENSLTEGKLPEAPGHGTTAHDLDSGWVYFIIRFRASMKIHFLNCFTVDGRVPAPMRTGTLCLLVESEHRLTLVDTGLGVEDHAHPPAMLRALEVASNRRLDAEEAAVRQIARLGYKTEDVRDILLTHMHFDHCGGLPDFPGARVHVHRMEYEAFAGPRRRWSEMAGYIRRHTAHGPSMSLYEAASETWFGFDAIRLPFETPMWLIPLFGHSRGHCGVAIGMAAGWLFHVGDAAPVNFAEDAFEPLVRFVSGPHWPRLREFRAAHPEIQMTTSHMGLDFFSRRPSIAAAS